MIDDVPEWFTVENFRDEIINLLCVQSSEMINLLMPQLQYAGFSYIQLVQRLYEGKPMSTGVDFYMSAACHFLTKPIVVIKPQFNTDKQTRGRPKFVFQKEYFYEQDSYLGDNMIPLKFIFNGVNYYVPYLQSDATRIIHAGSPILRGVLSSFNNLTDLIKAILPRASLNSSLQKLFLYLKAANTIVKGTHLAAGYSQSAEVEMVKIPGVNPLSEGTIQRKKWKTSTEGAEKEKPSSNRNRRAANHCGGRLKQRRVRASSSGGKQPQQQQQPLEHPLQQHQWREQHLQHPR